MSDTRLEEIKQKILQYTNDIIMGRKDILPYYHDVSFLLQELKKLQQENERYKKVLHKIAEESVVWEELAKETLKAGNE